MNIERDLRDLTRQYLCQPGTRIDINTYRTALLTEAKICAHVQRQERQIAERRKAAERATFQPTAGVKPKGGKAKRKRGSDG